MAVTYRGVSQSITANDILTLDKRTIKALVQAAVINMTEAACDMIADSDGMYSTKAEMDAQLAGVKVTTRDYLADMLTELREAVLEELSKQGVEAVVRAIKYDGDAVDEIDADVSFS